MTQGLLQLKRNESVRVLQAVLTLSSEEASSELEEASRIQVLEERYAICTFIYLYMCTHTYIYTYVYHRFRYFCMTQMEQSIATQCVCAIRELHRVKFSSTCICQHKNLLSYNYVCSLFIASHQSHNNITISVSMTYDTCLYIYICHCCPNRVVYACLMFIDDSNFKTKFKHCGTHFTFWPKGHYHVIYSIAYMYISTRMYYISLD